MKGKGKIVIRFEREPDGLVVSDDANLSYVTHTSRQFDRYVDNLRENGYDVELKETKDLWPWPLRKPWELSGDVPKPTDPRYECVEND